MTAKDVIRTTLNHSDRILKSYVGDLSDDDIKLRPIDGMNSIAWQLGHLISSERTMVEGIRPGSSPPLPDGFDNDHARDTADSADPAKFRTKDEYLALVDAQRAATLKALDEIPDAALDEPAPERFQRMCPTAGHVLLLAGNHVIMHLGQFVAVRRKLKKPVTI
jgi:uncharacterized damage-inducible protein DinB